jgi:hypothetical protein
LALEQHEERQKDAIAWCSYMRTYDFFLSTLLFISMNLAVSRYLEEKKEGETQEAEDKSFPRCDICDNEEQILQLQHIASRCRVVSAERNRSSLIRGYMHAVIK